MRNGKTTNVSIIAGSRSTSAGLRGGPIAATAYQRIESTSLASLSKSLVVHSISALRSGEIWLREEKFITRPLQG